MAILVNEIKKQTHVRLTVFAFVIALILNGAVAFRKARATDDGRPADGKTLAEIYAGYAENPGNTESYYDELTEYRKKQAKVQKAAKEAGTEFIETRQSVWTDGLYTDDIAIINGLREFASRQSKFRSEVGQYVENSEINAREFIKSGYAENSYEVKNQRKAGELYSALGEKTELHAVFINGWNDFYSFSLTGVLSVLMAIITGAVVFIYEKETGMLPIIKTTKKGRAATASLKLASSGLISLFCAAALTAETLLVFALAEGMNGGSEALQSLDAFRKSPFILSIRGYLPIFFAQRMLASLILTFVTALLAVCLYNYVLSFAASAAFTGLNLLLYSSGSDVMQNTVRYMNVYSLSEGTRLFSRYASLNFFGIPVPFYTAFSVLAALLSAILFPAAVILYCRNGTGVEIRFFVKLRSRITDFYARLRNKTGRRSKGHALSRNLSLLRHESFKQAVASRVGIVSLLLIAAGVLLFPGSDAFTRSYGYTDKLCYSMLAESSCEWSEEKHSEIKELKEKYEKIISEHGSITYMLEQGLISSEDYIRHNSEYVVANREIGAVTKLYDHSVYLRGKFEETGVRGYFLDERGWEAYLFRSPDYCLYAAILILFAGCFTAEYGSKPMSAVLRSLKRGRNEVFFSKFVTVIIFSSAMRAVCEAASLIVCAEKYGLPLAAAPALSSERLSELDSGISLLGLSATVLLIRLASALALGILAASASCLFRKSLPAIVASAALTLIPALGESSGLAFFSKADFLRFFEGGRLILCSAGKEGSPDFRTVITVLFAASVLTAAAAFAGNRRYNKKS